MSYDMTPCKGCKNPIGDIHRGNELMLARPRNIGYCAFCIQSGRNARPTAKPGVVRAPDLDAAARNPDGTYNGLKALSWLSEVLNPGKGFTPAEVEAIANDVKERLK